jgi:UDP-glucose 4-epimerase
LALEKYALMFHQLENLPVIIVRPSNPYGPKQSGTIGQGFIGAAIAAILKKQPVVMYGENGTIRDYIYIDDLVSGLVAALDCGNPGEIYNIGTGIGFNNREIIDIIKNELANPAGYLLSKNIQPSRSFDVAINVLSSARLTYVSGWRPNIDFKAGLKKTWTAAFQNK